jgi:hypothetical protein
LAAPLSLRGGLRRKEGESFLAYPALAPQRALRALSAVPGYYHTSLAGLALFNARGVPHIYTGRFAVLVFI